ncbi:aromatic-L-amino-acid decarboxylase-like [Clytia hemisphaerica]|uniref:Aromatic-L-amino-acid decarboxylase n=1 Tax=Clytia hemisphaerica TaxID=252671 RepID=A0A7M5TWG5_9CNID
MSNINNEDERTQPTINTNDDFRKFGKKMVDLIADYHENVPNMPVLPDVKPGYLAKLLPDEAPKEPEPWESICEDFKKAIVPGITPWNSPNFHAYFPTANSYAAVMGGMLADTIGCVGFTWIASPACTELEMLTMDWLAKMFDLPDVFQHAAEGHGGGVIQGSASESTLVAILAAKHRKLSQYGHDEDFGSKLIAYTSKQSHSSVEKDVRLAGTKLRLLETDERFRLRGDELKRAIEEDKAKGLIPFFVCASAGTTNVCAFDALDEISAVSGEEGLWMHVDAAYAGAAMICPEYRYLMKGIENTDSLVVSCNKWLMVNFPCAAMFVRDSLDLINLFDINPLYLKHDYEQEIPDFRHWQIPLGRRFRSLKLWMVLKSYGVKGLQENIRRQIQQAQLFEGMIRDDVRFEVVNDVLMGLVCFRLIGDNTLNDKLNRRVNEARKIHMTPAYVNDQFVLRFVIASRLTENKDVKFAWDEIKNHADILLKNEHNKQRINE